MTDKRRINGPPGGTRPPIFTTALSPTESQKSVTQRPSRTRKANELRKIYLKTGIIPSASGSAYLELQPSHDASYKSQTLIPPSSSLKLICTVHGPRPLPRSAPFSPNILLSTQIKFAPFAGRRRRGYIRDMNERDMAVHLETALGGMIIGDRWPKSGLDVTINILEGEDDRWWVDSLALGSLGQDDGWGLMTVLANCITVASAAIVDARIDCLDLLAGGVAAIVEEKRNENEKGTVKSLVLDPDPSEHENIASLCIVGYMPSQDEITEVWLKGDVSSIGYDTLIDGAVDAARASQTALLEAVKESAQKFANLPSEAAPATADNEDHDMQL